MKNTLNTCLLAAAMLAMTASLALAQAAGNVPADKSKQTTLNKYATSLEAYLMWRAKPKEVILLDVRTPEEYVFVGHPEPALNIPVQLFNGVFDPEKKSYGMAPNPAFVEQVGKRIPQKDATILVLCRSGGRAATAVNLLAQAGYTNAYNVVDSFEGDLVKDPESVFVGKRMVNGWKNQGLPWTYALDPNLVWVK